MARGFFHQGRCVSERFIALGTPHPSTSNRPLRRASARKRMIESTDRNCGANRLLHSKAIWATVRFPSARTRISLSWSLKYENARESGSLKTQTRSLPIQTIFWIRSGRNINPEFLLFTRSRLNLIASQARHRDLNCQTRPKNVFRH